MDLECLKVYLESGVNNWVASKILSLSDMWTQNYLDEDFEALCHDYNEEGAQYAILWEGEVIEFIHSPNLCHADIYQSTIRDMLDAVKNNDVIVIDQLKDIIKQDDITTYYDIFN